MKKIIPVKTNPKVDAINFLFADIIKAIQEFKKQDPYTTLFDKIEGKGFDFRFQDGTVVASEVTISNYIHFRITFNQEKNELVIETSKDQLEVLHAYSFSPERVQIDHREIGKVIEEDELLNRKLSNERQPVRHGDQMISVLNRVRGVLMAATKTSSEKVEPTEKEALFINQKLDGVAAIIEDIRKIAIELHQHKKLEFFSQGEKIRFTLQFEPGFEAVRYQVGISSQTGRFCIADTLGTTLSIDSDKNLYIGELNFSQKVLSVPSTRAIQQIDKLAELVNTVHSGLKNKQNGYNPYVSLTVTVNPNTNDTTESVPAFTANFDSRKVVKTGYDRDQFRIERDYYETVPPDHAPSIAVNDQMVPRGLETTLIMGRNRLKTHEKYSYKQGHTEQIGLDQISDMMGVYSLWVVPVAKAYLHGMYSYRDRAHHVDRFIDEEKTVHPEWATQVLLTTRVHQDFELEDQVMAWAVQLEENPVYGSKCHVFPDITAEALTDDKTRKGLDATLKRDLVAKLTTTGVLPDKSSVKAEPPGEISHQAKKLMGASQKKIDKWVNQKYIGMEDGIIYSAQMIFNAYREQIKVEFENLENVCASRYDFDYQPAVIFNRMTDSAMMNTLYILAFRHVSLSQKFPKLAHFGFNDYKNEGHVADLKKALKHTKNSHVKAMFSNEVREKPTDGKPGKLIHEGLFGQYGYNYTNTLVCFTNGDEFGDNIRGEDDQGSREGAIGCHSSGVILSPVVNPNLYKGIHRLTV